MYSILYNLFTQAIHLFNLVLILKVTLILIEKVVVIASWKTKNNVSLFGFL